jgi:hypothetical protein
MELTAALEGHENARTRHHRRHAPPDQLAARAAAPAPPAAADVLLTIQRGAGNQAAARLARRRKAPAKALEPPFGVGSVIAEDFSATVEINAKRELTVGTDGFATEQEAAVAAASTGCIGVVIEDPDGRLRAYETDMVPFETPARTIPAMLPAGRIVRFARVSSPKDPIPWGLRQAYIGSLNSSSDPERKLLARRMLVQLLVSEVGLLPGDVHDSTEEPPERGKVNVNAGLTGKRGHAGDVKALPTDRTTPLEPPTFELTPLAFDNRISLRGTVLHEFEHIHHTEKAIAAIERWRATEPKLEFLTWLEEKSKLSALDQNVIREQVTSGSQATEALAYMRGFMATFHLRALDDPERFVSLHHLAGEWDKAGHAVNDETVAQLIAYRAGLPPEHMAAFDAYVDSRRAETFFNRFPKST